MAKKISGLDPAGTLTGQEIFEAVQKGNSVKVTADQIATHALGRFNPKIWGIRKQIGSASMFWERINPEMHAERRVHKQCGRYLEDSNANIIDLHPTDSRKSFSGAGVDLTGSQGNVWWRKPAYYFKAEIVQATDGVWYEYQWMSDNYFDGAMYMKERSCSPWHMVVNRATSVAASLSFLTWNIDGSLTRNENGFPVYTANASTYRGGSNNASLDGTASSMLGVGVTAIDINTARYFSRNAGAHCGWFSILDEIRTLYRFEYACDDIQQSYNPVLDAYGNKQGGLGTGKSVGGEWGTFNGYHPFIPMGVTCPLGNQSGLFSYTIKDWGGAGLDKIIQVDSFLGLEILCEHIWTGAEDLLIYHDVAQNKVKAYYCDDSSKFANPLSDTSAVIPVGYKHICDMAPTSGWMANMSLPPLCLPTSVGGSPGLYVPDYYWAPPDAGWYTSGLGAGAFSGSDAGLASLFAYYRVSITDANWGFRLCR